MNHLELYTRIRSGKPTHADVDLVPLSNTELAALSARALKAESAERQAWLDYKSVEVEVRVALISADDLNSPQAEARYTILEGRRYAAEHKAATASGRAREARRQSDVANHDAQCHAAALSFYEGTPGPIGLKLRYRRLAA